MPLLYFQDEGDSLGSHLSFFKGNNPLHSSKPHEEPRIFGVVMLVLLVVVVPTLIGLFLDSFVWRRRVGKGPPRTPAWAVLMFLSSYLLLFPGLFLPIVSNRVELTHPLTHTQIDLLTNKKLNEPGIMIESMWSMIGYMLTLNAPIAATLLFLYAVVVPLVKLGLFVFGELARDHANETVAWLARASILCVQFISKWDSPKVLAYVFMAIVVKSFVRPPVLVGTCYLHTGFMCYTIYCIATLVASQAIAVPPAPGVKRLPLAFQWFGPRGLLWYGITVVTLFFCLFCKGATTPFLTTALDPLREGSMWHKESPAVVGMLASMHIPGWAHFEYTLVSYIQNLMEVLGHHPSMTNVVGFFFVALFVVLFTVLDMLCLLFAVVDFSVWYGRWGALRGTKGADLADENTALAGPLTVPLADRAAREAQDLRRVRVALGASHWLKYLSMADVFVFSAFVVGFSCEASFQVGGMYVSMGLGLWILLVADAIHYAAYFTISYAIEYETQREV